QDLVDASGTSEAPQEHVVILRIVADFEASGPLPNVLVDIGIDLSQVGDILTNREVAYVALTPDVATTAQRLLKRALAGVSSIEVLEPGMEPEGDQQEVKLVRLDKRDDKNNRDKNRKH
ncbi:unnamed protein product, partial [Polarella glacialis]